MRGLSQEQRRAGSHVSMILDRLASHEALNVTTNGGYPESVAENAIDFADVFRTPQVVHFHLPSALGTATSAEMGRLALYSLLSAAQAVGPERKQVYLFIDEFQRLVAGNLELFLQTARSMNIGVILANQTLMDLQQAGVDLVPTVRANTRFKQVFAASDLKEQQELTQSSGETIVHNRSWMQYLSGIPYIANGIRSMSLTETVTPRLRPNDILLATDDPNQSIVQIRRGAGYAQYGGLPFVMVSTHHITKKEYDERRLAHWPDRPDETFVTSDERPAEPERPLDSDNRGQQQAPAFSPTLFPDPVIGSPSPETESTEDSAPEPHDPFDELWRQQQARRGRKDPGDKPADPPQEEEQP